MNWWWTDEQRPTIWRKSCSISVCVFSFKQRNITDILSLVWWPLHSTENRMFRSEGGSYDGCIAEDTNFTVIDTLRCKNCRNAPPPSTLPSRPGLTTRAGYSRCFIWHTQRCLTWCQQTLRKSGHTLLRVRALWTKNDWRRTWRPCEQSCEQNRVNILFVSPCWAIRPELIETKWAEQLVIKQIHVESHWINLVIHGLWDLTLKHHYQTLSGQINLDSQRPVFLLSAQMLHSGQKNTVTLTGWLQVVVLSLLFIHVLYKWDLVKQQYCESKSLMLHHTQSLSQLH